MSVFGIHTGRVAHQRGSTTEGESATARQGARRRPLQLLLAAMVLVVGAIPFLPQSAGAAPLPLGVNNPPTTGSIISFPSRDFVSSTGWDAFHSVDVQVLRKDPNNAANFIQIGIATDVLPAAGLVEVNHPGGACWEGVTPNISAGDIVMLSGKDASGVVLTRDATTTANVAITQTVTQVAAGSVELRGTALQADGSPIPAAQLEMRLISGANDRFNVNNKRDLRAPRDGTFTIDAAGNWVATISGLGQADVNRALAAENRIMWLGSNPATTAEATVVEVGPAIAPGPAAPCLAPLQAAVVAPSRTQIDFPATEVNTSSAPEVVTLVNAGAGALADLNVSAITVTGIDAADFHVVDTCIGTPVPVGANCTVTVTFSPLAAGLKSAILQVQSNAGNSVVALNAAGLATGVGQQLALGVARPAFLGFATRSVGNTSPAGSIEIKNIGNAPLVIAGLAVSGANGADYAIAPTPTTTCATGVSVAPNATCSITLDFTPGAEGNRDATLTVTSNGAPVAVPLQGGGLVTAATGNVVPFDQFGTVSLGIFTARDFVSNGGFNPDEVITSQIIRSGVVIGQGTAIAGPDGIAEVNHPGGGCWETSTPNIRAGDVLRVTRPDGRIYEMTNADVKVTTRTAETASGSGIVVMKGYARDLTTGGPLPLAQIEARIIGATRDPFAINGKRSIRTGGGSEGTLTYDPISVSNPDGVNWTATWDLSTSPAVAHDVALAISEENRVLWLGRNPLALSEMTFWENGPAVADGPAAPCTAPGQPASPGIAIMPATQTFPALASSEQALRTFSVRNIGTAPLTISGATFVGAAAGDFTVAGALPGAIAPDAVGTFQVRFSPQGLGARTATMRLSDDSIGTPHTATVSGTGVATSQPAALATPTALAFPDTQVSVASAPLAVTVLNEGGQPLVFSALPTITGTNAGDFTLDNSAATACLIGTSLANGQTCTVSVVFTPSDVNGRSATLNIASNDPAGPLHIALSGVSTTTADGTFDPPRAPRDVQAFPVRDYVAAGGFAAGEFVRIDVYRGGTRIAQSEVASPIDQDPNPLVYNGFVEVNHVGGVGWATETPDILPGDVVRAVRLDGNGLQLGADQTHVARLSVTMPATEVTPGVVVMTGTAADPYTGAPLVAGSIEPRITKPLGAPLFDANGRRDLRGGLDGVVTWNGIQWTATFSGLSPADVAGAVSGDSKVVWLGRVPLNLSELTHWEWNEIPGPDPLFAATAPFLVQEPTATPATASLGFDGVGALPSAVVNITFRNGPVANVANPSVTPQVVGIVGLHAGDFSVQSSSCTGTLAAGQACTVGVTFNATAVGKRLAALQINHNGANGVTIVPLAGIGVVSPTLTSATSPVGRGSIVHLVGTNLSSTTAVTIGGQPGLSLNVVSDTAVDFVVPNTVGAGTATITVTAAGGSASINTTVLPDAPTISLLSPDTGKVGDTVTITGTNLLSASVTFNGVPAVLSVNSNTQITTTVPAGATTGLLRVATAGGATTSTFTVIPAPTITSFAPATARRGAIITVNGTNFRTGATTVAFTNATGAQIPVTATNVTATSLRVTVPNTAVQGPVIVSVTPVAGGVPQTTSAVFTVELAPANITLPVIAGVAGQVVTISGNNFLTTTKVSFNGRGATFTIVNSRTITATVPAGATTGPIQVNNKWGSSNSPTFTIVQVPTVTGFTPATVSSSVVADASRRVTLNGANVGFATSVVLVRGASTVAATAVTRVTNTQITFVVPQGTALGLYTIRVTNAAGSATSAAALTVIS